MVLKRVPQLKFTGFTGGGGLHVGGPELLGACSVRVLLVTLYRVLLLGGEPTSLRGTSMMIVPPRV